MKTLSSTDQLACAWPPAWTDGQPTSLSCAPIHLSYMAPIFQTNFCFLKQPQGARFLSEKGRLLIRSFIESQQKKNEVEVGVRIGET